MADDDINQPTTTADFESDLRSRQRLIEELKYLVNTLEMDCPEKLDDLHALVAEAKLKRDSRKPH